MSYGIEQVKGKVLTGIENNNDGEELIFYCSDNTSYKMYHQQDCCEHVYLDDINGDLNDLLNSEILVASEDSSRDDDKDNYGTETWTFYTLSTIKGTVKLRWYGSSNGYYSESVDVVKL